jgi:hypothetical protein
MTDYRSVLEHDLRRAGPAGFTLGDVAVRRERRQRGRRIAAGVVGLALAALVMGGWLGALTLDRSTPADDTIGEAFVGAWESNDPDGSHPVMSIRDLGDGTFEMELVDDAATVCDGAPATVTGTGAVSGARMTVAPAVLTCEGGEPTSIGEDLTFDYDVKTDTLFDSSGIVWRRPGSDTTVVPYRGIWPQTTREDAEEAQRRADAGDPAYTWQLVDLDEGPVSVAEGDDVRAPIVTRFVEERLGWEHYKSVAGGGSEGTWDVVFVRCEPGAINPLYPDDPYGGDCAPTIDETHYETVSVRIEQLVRRGPTGIWIVTRSAALPDSADAILYGADWFSRQYEQAAPPTEAELRGFLEAFLAARVAGTGAEQYLVTWQGAGDGGAGTFQTVPLLYATTEGRPYERAELRKVDWGPQWPDGSFHVHVRLFSDAGAVVVEQGFTIWSDEDGLQAEVDLFSWGTSENGEPVPWHFGILGGLVTFDAGEPWFSPWAGGVVDGEESILVGRGPEGTNFAVIEVQAPLPPCASSAAPATAEQLAARLLNDPELDATALAPVTIGGLEALRLDVVRARGAEICGEAPDRGVPVVMHADGSHAWVVGPGERMRVHLLAFPGDPTRTLAILLVAPQEGFDEALAAAEPILDTFEFAAP